jgi:nicotinate phosphoribosyltransferase
VSPLGSLYDRSLTLLTDFYQLTMAYGYWKSGLADHEAAFHLFFRKNPFKGGYAIACGLEQAIHLMSTFRFQDDDLDYLGGLEGNDGKPVFERAFLDYLRDMEFGCDVDAVPEGTVVFPHEPLMRLKGPLLQCQILETTLLNVVNFQTLVASKAARVCLAAQGDPVLEFGLRRAQGVDGALSASRAAYVGGCAATSNVLAGRLFGIPVKGTHAHAWVMAFDDEQQSFEAYAAAMPNNCVFLVDTYDTLDGVRKACDVGRQLRERGHEMVGVRLDSGDLAYLSIEARKILDEEGFPDAVIVASNDLDERVIASLKDQGATIGVWGVGTKLATCYDQPALGGVYKLAAIRGPDEAWDYKVKLSEQAIKVSNPGVQQVRRFRNSDGFVADAIYDEERVPDGDWTMVDALDPTRRKLLGDDVEGEDLLVPVFRGGKLEYAVPTLEDVRARVRSQLDDFHPGIARFLNPHEYPVGLEKSLYDLKTKLILEARGFEP